MAAVLGIAKAGPMQMIDAMVKMLEKLGPTRLPISTARPPAKAVMMTAKIGITGSASKNPSMVEAHPSPVITPR